MRILSTLSIATMLGSAAAQTTWTVPSGADLAPWIAQASPGDTLILGAAHPGFLLTKGLTMRPATGRTAIVALSPPIGLSSSLQIPAGQQASLFGLDFTNSGWTPWWTGGHPVVVDGVASFESCTFRTLANGRAYALQVHSGATTLRDCTLTGLAWAPALQVASGVCSVVGCQLFGSDAATGSGINDVPPLPAAVVLGGTLIASSSTFTPGASTISLPGYPVGPSPGLQLGLAGGTLFATDCTIRGGDYPLGASVPPPYTGGAAIHVLAGTAFHARCTLLPGNGAPPGPPTVGNAIADADLVGIASSGALQLGATWTATATAGASGQLLGFAFWFALSPSSVPLVPEPLWGPAAQAVLLGFTVPGAGSPVPFAVPVPNTPSLIGSQLWAQAIQLAWPQIRASAVVGGVIR